MATRWACADQGQTSAQGLADLHDRIPNATDVAAAYDSNKEDFCTRHDLFDRSV